MKKIYLDWQGFLGAKASTQEEQAKHFKWGINDFVKGIEGNNKRDRDGHRIRPSETPSQGSNQRVYDRRDSDKYGNGGRYGNRDRGRGVTKISRFGANSIVVLNGIKSKWILVLMPSSPPINNCGKHHAGKGVSHSYWCCFENVDRVGHLREDCKKANALVILDIILGMDWLTEHRATIDCHTKRVIFGDLNNPEFIVPEVLELRDFWKVFTSLLYNLLTKLMRKGEKFVWNEEREKSFEELKRRLVSSPILTLPSGTGGYQIYSDARQKNGLGFVLMQHERVIADSSRQLKPYEENYLTS
ncbi:putative reverse transcriptase domain-containing protein [Tanacetum coccineum]